jgi:hypothetical protein
MPPEKIKQAEAGFPFFRDGSIANSRWVASVYHEEKWTFSDIA